MRPNVPPCLRKERGDKDRGPTGRSVDLLPIADAEVSDEETQGLSDLVEAYGEVREAYERERRIYRRRTLASLPMTCYCYGSLPVQMGLLVLFFGSGG